MSRVKRGKERNRLPPFVALPWTLLNHAAWRELPPSAGKALPFFLGKVKTGFNDPARYTTDFSFSYTEGKRYGFALATFGRIIEELVRTGFIDPVDRGGLRSDGKSYNLFRLSKRWGKYGTTDFQHIEWREFQPRTQRIATSKMGVYNFKNGNKKSKKDALTPENEVVGTL
jgi:hypothetical protein